MRPFGLFVLSALLFCSGAGAEEVQLPHRGLRLNAALELVDGKTLADGVVLMTHGGLVHRDMETMAVLRQLLHDRGYNTLAINLSLGLDRRHGPYDCSIPHRHRNSDAAAEIGLWLEWLKRQGARRVTLMGHSRGGAQTALFAAERNDTAVSAVVLLAPAVRENTDAEEYQRRTGKPLAPTLQQARDLVKRGKGNTLLRHVGVMTCPDTAATAASFVSYFSDPRSVDSPSLIPAIVPPTLVLVASDDQVVRGLAPKVQPLIGSKVSMVIIEGADHTFRDLYADEVTDAIDAFLRGVMN